MVAQHAEYADWEVTGGLLVRPCGRAVLCGVADDKVVQAVMQDCASVHWFVEETPSRSGAGNMAVSLVGYEGEAKLRKLGRSGKRYLSVVFCEKSLSLCYRVVALQEVLDVVLLGLTALGDVEEMDDSVSYVHLLVGMLGPWEHYRRRLDAIVGYYHPWADPEVKEDPYVTDFTKYVR